MSRHFWRGSSSGELKILSHSDDEARVERGRKFLSQPDGNSIIYANLIPALGFSHMTFSIRDEFLPNRRPTIANWRATDHAARLPYSKDPAQCYSARLVF